jgi:hypothetical protein
MPDISVHRNDYHESGFKFVNTELDTGLTFMRIAMGAKRGRNRADKVDRNRMNARKAYDSALHFLSTASLNTDEARMIKEKIAALKSGLEKLGETL